MGQAVGQEAIFYGWRLLLRETFRTSLKGGVFVVLSVMRDVISGYIMRLPRRAATRTLGVAPRGLVREIPSKGRESRGEFSYSACAPGNSKSFARVFCLATLAERTSIELSIFAERCRGNSLSLSLSILGVSAPATRWLFASKARNKSPELPPSARLVSLPKLLIITSSPPSPARS